MADWQTIETLPEVAPLDGRPAVKVLLYSEELGIHTGEAGNLYGHYPFASIACFHGNAIEYWGVTHWMPLPPPPTA